MVGLLSVMPLKTRAPTSLQVVSAFWHPLLTKNVQPHPRGQVSPGRLSLGSVLLLGLVCYVAPLSTLCGGFVGEGVYLIASLASRPLLRDYDCVDSHYVQALQQRQREDDAAARKSKARENLRLEIDKSR